MAFDFSCEEDDPLAVHSPKLKRDCRISNAIKIIEKHTDREVRDAQNMNMTRNVEIK